jgi:hypothetical protein
VSEAPAEHAAEGFADFLIRSFRLFVENSFGREDNSAKAKAALSSALLDEHLLERVRFFGRAKTFQRRHFVVANRAYGYHTGADYLTAQDNRASSALGHSATEFRAT